MAKIDELLEFWDGGKNKDVFSRDRKDFLRSKNFASGNGFYEVDSKEWSEHRAKVYADFISPVVTGIVAMQELAPPEITNFEFDRKILSDVLREILCDGKSFMLAYNKGSQLKIKKLSNLQTYINEDFSKAIHVSKITREKDGAIPGGIAIGLYYVINKATAQRKEERDAQMDLLSQRVTMLESKHVELGKDIVAQVQRIYELTTIGDSVRQQ